MQRSGEARMRDVVATADRVQVVAGGSFDPRRRSDHEVLLDRRGRHAVDEVLASLACEDDDRPDDHPPREPAADDGLTVVFLEGRAVAATVTVVDHDLLLAPALWTGTTRLIDPSELHALLGDG